eukprot:7278603-Prymnesium_polylepis.1
MDKGHGHGHGHGHGTWDMGRGKWGMGIVVSVPHGAVRACASHSEVGAVARGADDDGGEGHSAERLSTRG